ncbi:hypothetical protein CR513_53532, partial [Mucuna pruriens]
MGWYTKLPQHILPKQTAKLKYSIGKSIKLYKRWSISTKKSRVDSLRMLYWNTELHTRLR